MFRNLLGRLVKRERGNGRSRMSSTARRVEFLNALQFEALEERSTLR